LTFAQRCCGKVSKSQTDDLIRSVWSKAFFRVFSRKLFETDPQRAGPRYDLQRSDAHAHSLESAGYRWQSRS